MPRKSKAQQAQDDFEQQLIKARQLAKITQPLAIAIKNIQRGASGLPPDEDVFSGLLNKSDVRERARISERECYRHSCMRMLATMGGGFDIWDDIANMEDIYSIAKNGEQWIYAIEMLKTRAQQGPATVINTGSQTGPLATAQKRSFTDRLFRRNKEEAGISATTPE